MTQTHATPVAAVENPVAAAVGAVAAPPRPTAHSANPHRTSSNRTKQRYPVTFVTLTIVAVLLTLPLIWLILTSLKPESDVTTTTTQWLPTRVEFGNYLEAVTKIEFFRYLGSSLFLSTLSGVLTTLSSACSGFAFARFRTRLRGPLFGVLVALMMTPPIITLIPTFLLFARAGMAGTYWPWVLWGLAGSPYLIFLFRQAFAALPRELEEAALLDGASYFRIFWQIFLPLSRPILVTAFVLTFNYVWADFIAPSLFLTDSNTTLAVAIAGGYVNEMGFPLRNLVAAGAVLYVIPMIVVFVLAQRWYITGMAEAGLK